MIDFYTRPINPWNVRIGVTATLIPATTAEIAVSHMSTAWYDLTVVG
jgi:hypothetical protein